MALDADIKADNLQCNILLYSFLANEVEPAIPFEDVVAVTDRALDPSTRQEIRLSERKMKTDAWTRRSDFTKLVGVHKTGVVVRLTDTRLVVQRIIA
jgi:hypothetical protein